MLRNAIIKGLKWSQFSYQSGIENLIKFVEEIYGKSFADINDDPTDQTVLSPEQLSLFQGLLRDVKSLPMGTIQYFIQAMSLKNTEDSEWVLSEHVDRNYVISLKKNQYKCIKEFGLICETNGTNTAFVSVEENRVFALNLFSTTLMGSIESGGLMFASNVTARQNLTIWGNAFAENILGIIEVVEALEGNIEARTKQYLITQARYSFTRLPGWGGLDRATPLGGTLHAEPITPPSSPPRKIL